MIRVMVVAAAVTMLAAGTARANDSAMNNGAYGPEPVGAFRGDESVVRMVREDLEFRVGKEETRVSVKFTFRNTRESTPAVQLVGFPDFGAAMEEGVRRNPDFKDVGWFTWESDVTGPLRGMRTLVNGKQTPSRLHYGFVEFIEDTPSADDAESSAPWELDIYAPQLWKPAAPDTSILMAWHVVQVTFPPGEDVVIERHYTAPNGTNVLGAKWFEYVTVTGAGWHGTIGELNARVELADGLTIDDLAWKPGRPLGHLLAYLPEGEKLTEEPGDGHPVTWPRRGDWIVESPTVLRIEWHDFEPRTDSERRGILVALKTPPEPPKWD